MTDRSAHFDAEERRRIAGRARTLHERLDGPPNCGSNGPDSDRVVERWRERFPSEGAFEERLDRDDLDVARVCRQVEATEWPRDEPLPDWIETVDHLAGYLANLSSPERRRTAERYGEYPFGDLLSVVVEWTRDRLSDSAVPATFSDESVEPMAEWLLARLVDVTNRVLYREFQTFLDDQRDEDAGAGSAGETDSLGDGSSAGDVSSTRYYDQFVDAMLGHGFRHLCLRYPVLARFVGTSIAQWSSFVETLSERVRDDRRLLCEQFGIDPDETTVTTVEPLSGDSHDGGRVPVALTFADGTRVVYKPRSVEPEVAFYDVLDRLDDHLAAPSFDAPELLERDGYGWMGWVQYAEPETDEAVERYYERAGALVCLTYVFAMNDCHLENNVVSGGQPTLVDLETMCHARIAPEDMVIPTPLAAVMQSSVLFTDMTPWSVADSRDVDGTMAADVAGIGSSSDPVELRRGEFAYTDLNTDAMSLESDAATIDRTANTVSVDGEDRPPSSSLDSLLRGFEETYDALVRLHDEGQLRSAVLGPVLDGGFENRHLYRSTLPYTRVRRSLTSTKALTDGVEASLALERLAVPFFDGTIETDRYWPVVEAERTALCRLDVPRFTARTDDAVVRFDGEPVGVEVDSSGASFCYHRLDSMGEDDRRRQIELLRRCFEPGSLASDEAFATASSQPSGSSTAGSDLPDDERLRRAAVGSFESVLDAAVETRSGRRGWVSASTPHDRSAFELMLAADDLYNGRGGIALSAAALYRLTGEDRYRSLADEILRPTRERLAEGRARDGHGGTFGVGSVVYALSVAGELLDDPSYYADALDASALVTDEFVERADALGVTHGVAGTLLGLLACHDRTDDSDVLDRALVCGSRLLSSGPQGSFDSPAMDDVGFASGASGVAYALARLGATAGADRYADAALDLLPAESRDRSVQSAERDLRPDHVNPDPRSDHVNPDQWCDGRTGVALARLATGRLLDHEALLADATAAAETVATHEPLPRDHLCCGNFGRVELLVEAASVPDVASAESSRPVREMDAARRVAGDCLARRDRTGTFELVGHAPSFANPTLFCGASGVSYSLARLCDSTLPCVMLLE